MIAPFLLAACLSWTPGVQGSPAVAYRVRPSFSPAVDQTATTWCSDWSSSPDMRVCVSALNASGTEGGAVCLTWMPGAVWDEVDQSRLPGCPVNVLHPRQLPFYCKPPIGGRELWVAP